MDTPSNVIPLNKNSNPEPSDDSNSGDLDSGSLDSDFFCELNGVTTQFPHKSGSLSSDLGGNLVPFDRDESEVGANDVEAQRTNIPVHKQGKNKFLVLTGLVAIPFLGVTYMMFAGNGETAKTVQVPAEAPASKPTAQDFAPDPRFAVAQSKLAMQQQEQQLLAAANAQKAAEDRKATTAPAATPAADSNAVASVATPPKDSTSNSTTPVTAAPAPIIDNAPTNVQPPIVPAPTVAEPIPIKSYQPPARVVERVAPRADNPPVRVATRVAPRTDNLPVRVATRVVPRTDNPPVRVATRDRSRAIKPSLVASRGLNNRETIKSTTVKTTPKVKAVTWTQASAAGVAVFGSRSERQVTATTQPMSAQIAARVIIPGQNRTVTLITPLQILGGESSQEILLRLEQAFIDTQGGVIISPHTIISAQLLVADNGMLRIGSAKAMIGSAEYPIAAGSLMLAATNNTPLIAELKRFGEGEIGRRDLGAFFMGALQGVGKVLTAPNTQTQITAGGAAISTTNNSQNVVGGILEGGASPLVQAWVERNQAEVKRLEGATRLWFLPAGSRMNLFATKPFSLK
jgi:hypothetical protein